MGVRGRVGLLGALAATLLAVAALVVSAALLSLAPRPGAITDLVVTAALSCAALAAGLVVGARRPGNVVGALLAALGLAPMVTAVSDAYDAVVSAAPGALPVVPVMVVLDQADWTLLYLPAAVLLLTFPDGHLLSRWWRPVLGVLLAVPVVMAATFAVLPGQFDRPYRHVPPPLPLHAGAARTVATVVMGATLVTLLAALVASLVSVAVRYRRSRGIERAQLRWFALGAVALPLTLLLCWLSYLLLDGPDLVVVGLVVMALGIPAATAIALLRHDLYDVERALAATTTYGLLSAGILAVYTVLSFAGGLALGHRSPLVVAAATAACAAALAPLRLRVRRAVDRRVHPVRSRVLEAVAALQAGTHAGIAPPEHLDAVLAAALGDPAVRVGFRRPGEGVDVDVDGVRLLPASSAEHQVPFLLGGEQVGVLIASAQTSRLLLREVAAASTLIVEVVRLRIGLSGALREVEESRSRFLTASYAERRRLERDLHDGAQQRLVSVGMSLRLAQRRLSTGRTTAAELDGELDGAVDQLTAAVAELRDIAHGLRPSSLDDGLGAALGALLERVPVPVSVDVTAEALPEETATTAYYVVSEAMANAVKHAAAARIALAVHRVEANLRVTVSDDGRGGARLVPGTGLAGLADRVAAAGGALALSSPLGQGTVLEVRLPCGS